MLELVRSEVYLTGEMSHDVLLSAYEMGLTVILTEHSNMERCYLPVMKEDLSKLVDYEILISKEDKDPIKII